MKRETMRRSLAHLRMLVLALTVGIAAIVVDLFPQAAYADDHTAITSIEVTIDYDAIPKIE